MVSYQKWLVSIAILAKGYLLLRAIIFLWEKPPTTGDSLQAAKESAAATGSEARSAAKSNGVISIIALGNHLYKQIWFI